MRHPLCVSATALRSLAKSPYTNSAYGAPVNLACLRRSSTWGLRAMLDSLAETQFRMNDTSASSEQISRAISLRNVSWAILILVTLYVCYFSHLRTLGLVGPDEPRYAWIARDMAESGDWVTPRLYGRPWFEKPALYYWGAALSFKFFGVNEASARLPSAV